MPSEASQSALQGAAGSGAELIAQLGNVMYVGAAVVFVAVLALALYGAFAPGKTVNVRRWIIGGGLIFPSVTLTALLVYSLAVGEKLSAIGGSDAMHVAHPAGGARPSVASLASAELRIHVIGHQWWWEVRYEQPGTTQPIVLANEIHLPIGRPVELMLSSGDVIHSFWVPALAGKVDMIPGRITRLHLRSDATGRFRALCAEYCGGQHALMALLVIAQQPEQFAAWLAQQAQPARAPADPFLRTGYEAFFRGSCQSCHTIRGTPAAGSLGPDLTHVGGRQSLGAGVLDNHLGTMAGWIAGAQDIKPGNRMPSPPLYTGVELRALASWLAALE
jgi:cytochrome c oxidase subunit 2